MKVIRLPILTNSTEKEGIMIHLVAPEQPLLNNPSQKREAEDAANTLLGVLATYGHQGALAMIVTRCVTTANTVKDLESAIQQMALPDGSQLVAGAPEYIPPIMQVVDKAHKAYGCRGQVLYAEEETMYLWIYDETMSFHISQLALAGTRR